MPPKPTGPHQHEDLEALIQAAQATADSNSTTIRVLQAALNALQGQMTTLQATVIALHTDLTSLEGDVEALAGRVDECCDGTEPPVPPPDPVGSPWSLQADPNQAIRPEWEPWFSRTIHALRNPSHYQSWQEAADGGDLYHIFRVWGHVLHVAVLGLRATAHPEFVAIIAEMLDRLQGGLIDNGGWMGWTYTYSGATGYEYWGTPWHQMETQGAWGVTALAAAAMRANGDDARADFWFANLASQVAAWRAESPIGFPRHTLTHPWMHHAMFSHFTGDAADTDARLAAFRSGLRTYQGVKAWHHYHDGPTTQFPTPQIGRYYPSYSASAVMQLFFEGLDVGMTLENMADGWNENIYPDEGHSDGAWSISNYALAIAFDQTGELRDYADAVNVAMGDDKSVPRRAYIACGMLAGAARSFPPARGA